jgi:nicotinamide mononucleotide (NMN) deamidase PncC
MSRDITSFSVMPFRLSEELVSVMCWKTKQLAVDRCSSYTVAAGPGGSKLAQKGQIKAEFIFRVISIL